MKQLTSPPVPTLNSRLNVFLCLAIHWRGEAFTFLFHGNNFWKIDEFDYQAASRPSQLTLVGRINESIWHGLPDRLDAAFIDDQDITHFIKKRKTWQFNRMELKLVQSWTCSNPTIFPNCFFMSSQI